MNESNEQPPQRGFLHSSPKKKLSFRNKEKIEDVRRGLKDAKDISARNLMAKIDCDGAAQKDSESSVEEVVVIEEVTEELEDESVEYIEEIIEDDDDSYLEPLPPPIEIPDALQVKDDDDDAAGGRSSNDGEESDEDTDDEPTTSPPAKAPVVEKESVTKEPVSEDPSSQKEQATNTEKETVTQPVGAMPETNDNETKDNFHVDTEVTFQINSVRPMAVRGMSYAVDGTDAPVAETAKTENNVSDDAHTTIAWTKPDWTKNTKLRPTGKSAKENLAKPITSLPHLKKSDTDFAPTTPAATPKSKVKQVPKTPTPSGSDAMAAKAICPKSAPTRANAAVSMGNEDLPQIEWTKPEWTRKKVLRDTSKGQKILSGQEISRPIGGIRPVED